MIGVPWASSAVKLTRGLPAGNGPRHQLRMCSSIWSRWIEPLAYLCARHQNFLRDLSHSRYYFIAKRLDSTKWGNKSCKYFHILQVTISRWFIYTKGVGMNEQSQSQITRSLARNGRRTLANSQHSTLKHNLTTPSKLHHVARMDDTLHGTGYAIRLA